MNRNNLYNISRDDALEISDFIVKRLFNWDTVVKRFNSLTTEEAKRVSFTVGHVSTCVYQYLLKTAHCSPDKCFARLQRYLP